MTTTATTLPEFRTLMPRRLAGAVLVVFWVIAIVLWSIAHLFVPHLGAFMIDVGIVFASVGFAAPFTPTKKGFKVGLLLGLLAIAAFALGDFVPLIAVSYFLRVLVPLLALLAPMNVFANNFRIF
jgi:hypothetical protein